MPDENNNAFARRDLLRLAVGGAALGAGPSAFAQSGGGTPKRGGKLTIAADADPIGLDATTTTAYSSYDFTALLYSGLLRWSAEMKAEPDLATGFEQPNDTTYVFHLRDGVKFHNGQKFDAEDVKYHLRPHPQSRDRQPERDPLFRYHRGHRGRPADRSVRTECPECRVHQLHGDQPERRHRAARRQRAGDEAGRRRAVRLNWSSRTSSSR